MSSSPSVIHVYGDLLDYLLHAYRETQEQWNASFDPAPILPELSKELYECGLNHHQLDMVKAGLPILLQRQLPGRETHP